VVLVAPEPVVLPVLPAPVWSGVVLVAPEPVVLPVLPAVLPLPV
jgi:hypothetical protein